MARTDKTKPIYSMPVEKKTDRGGDCRLPQIYASKALMFYKAPPPELSVSPQ